MEYLKKLSDTIENRIPQSETDKELRSLFMLHKKVLLAAAPFDFESYLLYVEWEREPDKKFYVPRREVMHPVVQAMQDLIDDRLDLLTISMPPGTGKSTLGIFFLSWVMGRFPDSQSLASAHSGMLTRSFYDGVYQIITDSEYLWADVFPGVKLAATNSKEEAIDLHKKHRFSTLTYRAINASLTGATRCDKILYADDLCSGIEEAMSKERLDISTYKIFLMQKNTAAWEKLIDIKEFPDLGGAPEMLETTTLSDKMQTYIPGIQSLDSLEFTANYTLEEYKKLKAMEGTEKEFAVWFGGTEAGDTVTPTGDSGKFKFKGSLSVYANGGGTNEVVEMTITIAPSTGTGGSRCVWLHPRYG